MAKDPYRYFRIEAQELLEGLSEGLLALEKRGADGDVLKRVLRLAHTFKGASRVVKRTDIGDLAHQMEDVLSPVREAREPVEQTTIDRALALLDKIRVLVARLPRGEEEGHSGAEGDVAVREAPETASDAEQTIRISVNELDVILESAFEAYTAAAVLRAHNGKLEALAEQARDLLVADFSMDGRTPAQRKRAASLARLADELQAARRNSIEGADRVMSELAELRTLASELRLVPAKTLVHDLQRVVRDAARELGKEVVLFATGTETHIDAHVLAGLRSALIHLVRNCVAHGIEDPAARLRSAKPAEGRIDIHIERRGHDVAISCRDDGGGLDLELVRRAAVERRLVSQDLADTMDQGALAQLLLRGGVSTSRAVSDVSGRGVGLEAVSHGIAALKGEVKLHSTAGQGTVVELLAPLSLSSLPTLSAQVDGQTFLLPLSSVRQALRLRGSDISRDADGERVAVDGQVLPFLSLRRALKRSCATQGEMQSAVIIEAEGQRAALGVDSLGGARTIVIRGIPEHAAADPIVSGAAFDGDGIPRLVLAPGPLVRAASSGLMLSAAPAKRSIAPLLVIDDSLTTRMLEQSILESAGYRVDLAISAEDALDKARERHYGLFLVDVEMPGMSGFEFIETIRNDPKLRETPAILITSRDDQDDKRRGKQVGAQAYIVKSEFDQALLIETIRRLLP